MADFALQFDTTNNYLTLGTMGSFGSNLASGFYAKFQIKTTSTTVAGFGFSAGNGRVTIGLNQNHVQAAVSGALNLYVTDQAGNSLVAGCNFNTGFNDGITHTIEILATMSTNTLAIYIDGNFQTISYNVRTTPSNFANFGNPFNVGAGIACIIDNLLLGTSSSALYGNYVFNEGTGPTTADTSGNGNTGTLTAGSGSVPAWVTGLNVIPPTVTDSTATGLTCQITGNGNVTNDNGATVTERGFCWDTSANPTTSNSKVIVSGTTGAYTGLLSPLTIGQTYHYRSYAINSVGTSYGADQTFRAAIQSVMMGGGN